MSLIACGINHNSAPVAIRERLSFSAETVSSALQDLLQLPTINEAVILSTCNRTEVYTDQGEPQLLAEWLAAQHQFDTKKLLPHFYTHSSEAAIRHLLRVTSGLDSMLVGEPQIFGQMKKAYHIAHDHGAVGQYFQKLFQTIFAVTKYIRHDTGIGRCPVSVAFAATDLARKLFSDLPKACVLLIGAGETIELVATHLVNHGVKRLIVANRSLSRAQSLAKKFFGHWVSMSEVSLYLCQADIVVTAATADSPLLSKNKIEIAMRSRRKAGKKQALFIVDLAVPRNVEPDVCDVSNVYLYNIDDLQSVINDNLAARQAAAKQAEAFVEIETAHFIRELRSTNAADTICAYRERMMQFRDEALEKALEKLKTGVPAEKVLKSLSHRLTNKIMHHPSEQLRQAAYDNRPELLMLARRLFDL